MKLVFIRHGATAGNEEKRYIGRTDEGLSPAGAQALVGRAYPPVRRVYVSPMLRCRQTAEILYPGVQPIVAEDFRECDFGEFEYKNYRELDGDPRYQAWIDSEGELPFPGGESKAAFSARCQAAYRRIAESFAEDDDDAAIVVHGGTIMAVLERFAEPRAPYYSWQVKPGGGFVLEWMKSGALWLLTSL